MGGSLIWWQMCRVVQIGKQTYSISTLLILDGSRKNWRSNTIGAIRELLKWGRIISASSCSISGSKVRFLCPRRISTDFGTVTSFTRNAIGRIVSGCLVTSSITPRTLVMKVRRSWREYSSGLENFFSKSSRLIHSWPRRKRQILLIPSQGVTARERLAIMVNILPRSYIAFGLAIAADLSTVSTKFCPRTDSGAFLFI